MTKEIMANGRDIQESQEAAITRLSIALSACHIAGLDIIESLLLGIEGFDKRTQLSEEDLSKVEAARLALSEGLPWDDF